MMKRINALLVVNTPLIRATDSTHPHVQSQNRYCATRQKARNWAISPLQAPSEPTDGSYLKHVVVSLELDAMFVE